MKFVDQAKVRVVAGNGGPGCVSWRREKYVPQGGPDGGNGGCGGAVIFHVNEGLNTLIDFSFTPVIQAKAGGKGESNNSTGADGNDTIVPVAVGTQIFYNEELIADLSSPSAMWVAARGGRGGKGNAFFTTAQHQAPDYAQPGQLGEKFEFKLVLKSIADVGLVGYPNVGKSTLLSTISNAQPKIANYPFTTLRPNLGVVEINDKQRYVVADIPGLIPEAHKGKGLGAEFLRHIERTSLIAQLIDLSTDSSGNRLEVAEDEDLLALAKTQFETIDTELEQYTPELARRPRVVVFSKIDDPLNLKAFEQSKSYFEKLGYTTVAISSKTTAGISDIKYELYKAISDRT